MEIQRSPKAVFDPYASARLEKGNEARQNAKAAQAPSEAAQGDTVNVSQDALLLTEARRAAQNSPDVRAEKVEELRLRVADGTYRPDSRQIAANLVREEPGLFRL